MRKNAAPKRPVVKDPVYGSEVVTQLVNKVLLDGKKSVAERIVYGALEKCKEKTGTDPVLTLERLWAISSPSSKFGRVAWAVLPTRCRLRCGLPAPIPWPCAGW